MKKIVLGVLFAVIGSFAAFSQGIEDVIVEQYYVATGAEGDADLTAGAVTYRIHLDLAPGYIFQAAFGNSGHELFIETSTNWYNNGAGGATTANGISTGFFGFFPTLALDSWISAGAGASGQTGVLQSEDTDGSLTSLVANDGLISGSPLATTELGLDLSPFDGSNPTGRFSTTNGSWAALGGTTGATASNTVLIAQVTTDGALKFELNVQLESPTGAIEQYVAKNATGDEIESLSLTYPAPKPGCTDPIACNYDMLATIDDGTCIVPDVAACEYCVDATTIAVADSNNDGTCDADDVVGCMDPAACNYDPLANIEDGSCVVPTAGCTECNATNDGLDLIDADGDGVCDGEEVVGCMNPAACNYDPLATDDDAASCNVPVADCSECDGSGGLQIIDSDGDGICDKDELTYIVGDITAPCSVDDICVDITPVVDVVDVIGYDVVMNYNPAKVTPTGVVNVNSAAIDPAYTDYLMNIDFTAGIVNLAIYLTPDAPVGTGFNADSAESVFCISFAKTQNFELADTANFTVPTLVESYATGNAQQIINDGTFITYRDSLFNGNLKYWSNNVPIAYSPSGNYLPTNIYGNDASCSNRSAASVLPNLAGAFTYNIGNGDAIEIVRDIAPSTDVMAVINGFDAYKTTQVVINDPTFVPSVFELLSMDVNLDGAVTAGDISQINQRTVLMIDEYNQAVTSDTVSKDWLFVSESDLTGAEFQISSSYPADDGAGYSKWSVPSLDHCLVIPGYDECAILPETYVGVMLGDVDGSYRNIAPDGKLKSGTTQDKVVLDLANATTNGGSFEIPVQVISAGTINSVDMNVKFNNTSVLNSDVQENAELDFVNSNFSSVENNIRITSGSVSGMNSSVFTISVNSLDAINANDFSVKSYVNGVEVLTEVGEVTGIENVEMTVNVFPVPASNMINVVASEASKVQIFDITGKLMHTEDVNANQLNEINVSSFENGAYILKVVNEAQTSNHRIIIEK